LPQVDGLSMDIAAYASAQKASQVQSDMSVGVLSKLLDQQKAQGVATAKLIEGAAVRPQEPGKGGSVDVTA